MNSKLIAIFFLCAKLSNVAEIITKFDKNNSGFSEQYFDSTVLKDNERKRNENIVTETTESNFATLHDEKHLDTHIPMKVKRQVDKSCLNVLAMNREIVSNVPELNNVNSSYSCTLNKQPSSSSLKKTKDPNRLPVVVKLIEKKSLTVRKDQNLEDLNSSINVLMDFVWEKDEKTQSNEPLVCNKKYNHNELKDQKDHENDQAVTEQDLPQVDANSQSVNEKILEVQNVLLKVSRQSEDVTATEESCSKHENKNLSTDVEKNLEATDLQVDLINRLGEQTDLETEYSNQKTYSPSDAQNPHVEFSSNDGLKRCMSKKSINASSFKGETPLSMFGSGVLIHSNFLEEFNDDKIVATNGKNNIKKRKNKKSSTFCLSCVSGNISDDPADEENKLNAKKQLVY